MTQKEDFYKIVSLIKREGVQELVKWLDEETDFFTAPASTIFHSNYEGGLVEHTMKVLKFALLNFNMIVKERPELEYLRESVVICALFHDISKISLYKKEKKWTKDEFGKWKEYMGWNIKDDFPLPHSTKSLYIIQGYVKLTNSEALAICYHMGGFDPSAIINGPDKYRFDQAFEHPLVKIIMAADIVAGSLEETRDLKNI